MALELRHDKTAPQRRSDLAQSDPAPDGAGAWMIVASAFVASFVVFGVIYSFGVFLRPIAATFHTGATAGSVFFSATAAIYYGFGAPAGRLADRLGPRVVVAAGAVILGIGLVSTALVDQVWLACLTYGVGVGVGGACCYVPTLSLVGGWFVRHRNTALGIAAAGTGGGTMAVPPIAAVLIRHFGWRGTDMMFGLAATALLLGCAAAARPAPAAAADNRRKRSARQLFRSREFVLLYVSWVLGTTALFVPFVFLPGFARDHGAGTVAAAALLSVIGGTSILGRVLLGPLGDRLGVLALYKITVLVMALSYAIWLLSPSYAWLVLFAAALGVNYGGRIAAVPAVLIEYFGVGSLATTLGLFFTATGFAALIGPPVAGIAAGFDAGHRGAILFALVAGLLGFAVIAPLRGALSSHAPNVER